jgi:signal transduction histidine kinase
MGLAGEQVRPWRDEEISLAEAVGRQLGSAVERLNLIARIQEQARLVQQIMDHVPEGVLLLDHSRRIALANPAAEAMLPELLPAGEIASPLTRLGPVNLDTLFDPPGRWIEISAGAGSAGANSTVGRGERTFEAAAQSLQRNGMGSGWVLVLREVTEERENQRRIQMQDRLATVGQLAAGIAHDFNNIMAAIVVYTDLLLMDEKLPTAGRDRLVIIQQQVQRASSLIRQILDFSRRAVMEQSELDLLPFIKELDKLLGRVLPETIRLNLDYQPGAYLVTADPTRLQQVFMNLALNARDAMPTGGVLSFRMGRLHLAPGDPAPVSDLEPGKWIWIEVHDTGEGIPAESLPHIFEPFFTTKPVGKGTGLGLAQVYGIIKQHGGSLDVCSRPGEGATFTLYLPALELSHPIPLPDPAGEPAYRGEGEQVLLVEDDEAARQALRALFEAQNYRVETAINGLDALFKYDPERFKLVVSDIVMPEMGGMELYRALRNGHPEVKILFITGHPLDEGIRLQLEGGSLYWLQKPFSMLEISRLLRQILEN